MPDALIYLGIMLAVICLWFMVVKRPVYEAVFLSFIVLLFVTDKWVNVWTYLYEALSTDLLYSMAAFVAMSIILTKTKIIDGATAILLSLFGRIRGGAGYASTIASAFMGALSGSGPGNIMSTGVITIPAMKRSGFPAELAANIESNASYLGNMIPPSANIVAALGAYRTIYGEDSISEGQFWMILWGISLWFIAQRLITVWGFCKYYKVEPMKKEDIPKLGEVIKNGWQGLLLPIIIFLPFLFDFLFKDSFFTDRLGADGAKALSKCMLMFTAGIASIYCVLATKNKKQVTPHGIATMFFGSVKSIAPTIGVCYFGYAIGELFADMNVATEMESFIVNMDLSKFGMVLFICVITCFLGMAIPGSSMTQLFGPTFIVVLGSVGVNPLLAAAMLPCICGVMCGITPPLALGMYAGMTIAESDFSKTVKNDLWWVALQFILQVVVLMGLLPILGL